MTAMRADAEPALPSDGSLMETLRACVVEALNEGWIVDVTPEYLGMLREEIYGCALEDVDDERSDNLYWLIEEFGKKS